MAAEAEFDSFAGAFTEWVEACWFGEIDAADLRLEAMLAFPPDVILAGSLSLLTRLLEAFTPAGVVEVAAALAEHLIITGPDPEREQLIRDVVVAAGSRPAARALVERHSLEAMIPAALECASLLTQALANRHGVVPSSILDEL
jgi:hypothetical protein